MWVSSLKNKIIAEYNQMVYNYSVGKPFDYTHILDMINLIEVKDNVNNASMIAKSFMLND
jgi:hypothetical protein